MMVGRGGAADGRVLVEGGVYRLRDGAGVIEKGVDAVDRVWNDVRARGVVADRFFETR